MLIDKYLPKYHFNEYHSKQINGTTNEILSAVESLKNSEISRVKNILMNIRIYLVNKKKKINYDPDSILLEDMQKNKFYVLERSENEIVIGLIGKFWNLTDPSEIQVSSAEEYLNFDDGEFGIVAFNFLVKREEGKNELTTETRIKIDDPKSRRKFRIYWFFIYLGSSYIRVLLLKAIKRKVEKGKE